MKNYKIFYFLIFMGFIFGFIFVCGCVQSQSTSTKYAPSTTVKHIRSVGIPNTYQKYVNNEDYFSVYLPPDWSTSVIDKSEASFLSGQNDVLQKIVYFSDKDTDKSKYTFFVFGVDSKLSNMVGSGNSYTDLIAYNDGLINSYKNSLEKGGATNIVVNKNIENGDYENYGVVKNTLTFNNDELKIKSKIVIINVGSVYYNIFYYAIDDVYDKQIATVNTIIPTFESNQI